MRVARGEQLGQWHGNARMFRQNPNHMSRSIRSIGHLLVMVALVLSSASVMAQSGNRFGIKGGVSWSNLRGEGEDASDKDLRTAFHGGVFGRLAPNDHLGVQAELLYSPKGTKVSYDGIIDQEVTFKLSYLEVPVFAVIGVGNVIEVHAGVYAAYLLSSKVRSEGDLGSDEDELDRDNFQGADYGLLIGAGANMGHAQLGVRYVHGMADLAASDDAEFLLGHARNSTVQLYLAIGLNGK
jgi:hypothetical protein